MPSCLTLSTSLWGWNYPRFTGDRLFSFPLVPLFQGDLADGWVGYWAIWVVFESVPERSLSGRWGHSEWLCDSEPPFLLKPGEPASSSLHFWRNFASDCIRREAVPPEIQWIPWLPVGLPSFPFGLNDLWGHLQCKVHTVHTWGLLNGQHPRLVP